MKKICQHLVRLALVTTLLSLGLTACKSSGADSTKSEKPAKSEHPKSEHPK